MESSMTRVYNRESFLCRLKNIHCTQLPDQLTYSFLIVLVLIAITNWLKHSGLVTVPHMLHFHPHLRYTNREQLIQVTIFCVYFQFDF